MCQHDKTFQIDNESNGGNGCPRCNADRANVRWSTDAERAAWKADGAEKAAQAAQAKMSEFEAHLKMLCADTDIEAPEYPGMWK